jgi:hypothetical protein
MADGYDDEPKPMPEPGHDDKKHHHDKKHHDEKKEEEEKIHVDAFANLHGTVMGYLKEQYTRPITAATVFLKVHIRDDKKGELIYNLTKENDIIKLAHDFPEVYHVIAKYHHAFEAHEVDQKDGSFSIKELPVSWWCYIVGAYVDKKEYDITQKLGNNGFNKREEIKGPDLAHKKNLEGIIVPVEDEWLPDIPEVPVDDRKEPPTEEEARKLVYDKEKGEI